jgi:hypothetical protein
MRLFALKVVVLLMAIKSGAGETFGLQLWLKNDWSGLSDSILAKSRGPANPAY